MVCRCVVATSKRTINSTEQNISRNRKSDGRTMGIKKEVTTMTRLIDADYIRDEIDTAIETLEIRQIFYADVMKGGAE